MSRYGIAVVIPCYNLGRPLEEALQSVRRQSRLPEEVVVVDDGSWDVYTRQALALINGCGVTVISTENRGPAEARNLGIRQTRSPLLVLLDADDLLEPTYLEEAASVLESRPELGFVSCAIRAFGDASYRWKPPPCSIVETIARGGVHISTMFRRELWERIGGFDSTLPAYEDTDFWLSAMELGYRGTVLDEALLRYRVRRGSRYHHGISPTVYERSKAAILRKHEVSLASHAEDVFVSLVEFQAQLRAHARTLSGERLKLEAEIGDLRREVKELGEALERKGMSTFTWGDVCRPPVSQTVDPPAPETIRSRHIQDFLDTHRFEVGSQSLTIRSGESWPEVTEASLDTLIVIDALAGEHDIRSRLACCRRWLRPGGMLLATFPCVPIEQGTVWGLTEASIRQLLSEVFPLDLMEVKTCGNLLTCVGSILGIAPDHLRSDEIEHVDPWYPLLVLARAQAPPSENGRQRSAARETRTDRPAAAHAASKRAVVLAYHRIARLAPDTHGLCTSPDSFRSQMELLRHRFAPVPLSDVGKGVREGQLPTRAVAVSFDDGYADNLHVASPILSELGIPATFFVNTHELNEKREAWWDTIERILISEGEIPKRLEVEVGNDRLDLMTATAEQRRRALFTLHGALLRLDVSARDHVIHQLCRWSGLHVPVRPTHALMTGSDIECLSKRPGHEIAAHTHHHLLLPAHPIDVRRRELVENRARLERLTGCSVKALSYPFGVCDAVTTQIVDELGFVTAFTVEEDAITIESDPLRLPRLEIRDDDLETFHFKLVRWLEP